MDKMIGLGTRMQKAIASGDYDNIYDGDGNEKQASPAAAASPSTSPGVNEGNMPGYTIKAQNPAYAPLADDLTKWAHGDLSFMATNRKTP